MRHSCATVPVKIWWNARASATEIRSYSFQAANRQIVFSKTFKKSGAHTPTITVSGTAGHPRVDVDAFPLIDYVPAHSSTAAAAQALSRTPRLVLRPAATAIASEAHR